MPGLLTIAPGLDLLKGGLHRFGSPGAATLDFPLNPLRDEDACTTWLVDLLHPDGLVCPWCGEPDRLGVPRRHRAPVLDYQCGRCRCVFNAWTGTALQGLQRPPSQIVLIRRGLAQGVPTPQLARELGCDRMHLLELRHRLQESTPGDGWTAIPGVTPAPKSMRFTRTWGKKGPARRPRRPAAATGQ